MHATPEPLWSAITLAVGGPELKAGGEAAWQGLKTLFSRAALTGLTSDNVLPRALSAAQIVRQSRKQPAGEAPGRAAEQVWGRVLL